MQQNYLPGAINKAFIIQVNNQKPKSVQSWWDYTTMTWEQGLHLFKKSFFGKKMAISYERIISTAELPIASVSDKRSKNMNMSFFLNLLMYMLSSHYCIPVFNNVHKSL
jgi:hypothetical protein